jgi:hypothetical protein
VLRERARAGADIEQPIMLPDDYGQVDRTASWTTKRLLAVSGVTAVAGVVAGMLGIGGGMVIGPLFLGERRRGRQAGAWSSARCSWVSAGGAGRRGHGHRPAVPG